MTILKRLVSLTVVLSLFLTAALTAAGCFFVVTPTDIRFVDNGITMRVNDQIRIGTDYAVEVLPLATTNKSFTVSTNTPDMFEISHTNSVRAVKEGTAKLFATSVVDASLTAEITVTVLPQIATSNVEITVVSGLIYQMYGFESEVVFALNFNNFNVSGSVTASWFVNNEKIRYDRPVTEPFPFTPKDRGTHDISAEVCFVDHTITADISVKVFNAIAISPFTISDPTALLQEDAPFRGVTFKAVFEVDKDDPLPSVVWLLNGEAVTGLGNPNTFRFIPQHAGRFSISLLINGELVLSELGGTEVEVIASGVAVPENIVLDYSSSFPTIMLLWDMIGDEIDGVSYSIRIEMLNGAVVIDDLEVSDNQIDLTDILGREGNTIHIFNTSFRIFVKSLGGGIFRPSIYAEPIVTQILLNAAEEFLLTTYMNGWRNYYAASIYDLADMFRYHRLFREVSTLTNINPENPPSVTFTAYLGFDRSEFETTRELIERAISLKNTTGRVSFSFTRNENVLEVTVRYLTDGLPTRVTIGEAHAPPLNSAIPRVNFDPALFRPDDFVLPIDSITQTMSVSTSEQLFSVIEQGFRPIPVLNSTADRMYNEARTMLRHIITDCMDDFEKALAIYTFVMWRITYDHAAMAISTIDEAVRFEAFYLESFFNNNRPFAVCDGISKAVSLLLNMEGVPAVRVVGEVSVGFGQRMGHAWNKVFVYDEWYIIDATWGDKAFNLPNAMFNIPGSGTRRHEVATKSYFLLTDEQLRNSHFEDFPSLYPRTSLIPFNIHSEFTVRYKGRDLNFYMNDSNTATQAANLADYMLSLLPTNLDGRYTYFVGDPNNPFSRTETDFFSFDIRINNSLIPQFNTASPNHPFTAAFRAAGLTSGTDFFIINETDTTLGITFQHIFLSVYALI